jgi:cyclopropane fatty-acyl-phospholipid synthase-like methyltransferase
VDYVAYPEATHGEGTTVITAKILDAELPAGYFDGIWVSNFLEHLPGQEGVAEFLERMHEVASPGGWIAIMGPNYRYAARGYPRFLPYSFNGILPPSPRLTGLYLRFPPAWRVLGKQFLIIGRR